MHVLDHLTQEHRKAEDLMDRLSRSEPGAERDGLLQELHDSLGTHMAVEERFIYPLISDDIDEEAAADATDEHELSRRALADLVARADEGAFVDALEMLRKGIDHHVDEEESELFPKLRERAADELADMDPEDLEAKVERSPDTIDLTRDELYEKAKEQDVAGRSSMTKEELAHAVGEESS